MGLSAAIYETLSPAGPGTVTITVGFQPKAIFVLGAARQSNGQIGQAIQHFGFAVSTSSQKAFCIASADADGSNAWRRQAVDKVLTVTDQDGSLFIEAAVSAITSTGLTLNFTTSASGYQISVLALGGSDISGAEIKEMQAPAATGNQTYSGLAGNPALMFFAGGGQTVNTTGSVDGPSAFFLGWAASSAARGVVGLGCGTGNTHHNASLELTNKCVGLADDSGTRYLADLVSAASGQFVLNWTTVGARDYLWALCLYGTFQSATFSNSSPTTAGNQDNALGFSPAVTLIQSWGKPSASAANVSVSNSIGLFDGTTNRVCTFIDQDAVKHSSACDRDTQLGKVLQMYTPGPTPTKLVEAGVADLTNRVRLNFTTVDSAAREYVGVALGSAASSPVRRLWQLAPAGTSSGGDYLVWELSP